MADSFRRADAITLATEFQRLRSRRLDPEAAAERLGITPRHARRIVHLLQLPPAIQTAVRREALPATQALKLFGLPAHVRELIAARIEDGERAKVVAAEYLATTPKPPRRYILRLGAELVRAQLRALIRVFGSEHFVEYCRWLECKLGPDHHACRQLVTAENVAMEIERRLKKAAEHIRSLMATSPFLAARQDDPLSPHEKASAS